MIIKSHIRGGYRAAADYLRAIGKNESIRLVDISDTDAHDLDEAFRHMRTVAKTTRVRKPLHHVSINPHKDERLTDAQVFRIIERCERAYGYAHGEHQRVIVEHVLHGRQHFHVIWNRVNLGSGRVIWPGHHWKKSKQVAREMEQELGLKRPGGPRTRRMTIKTARSQNLTGRPWTIRAEPCRYIMALPHAVKSPPGAVPYASVPVLQTPAEPTRPASSAFPMLPAEPLCWPREMRQ